MDLRPTAAYILPAALRGELAVPYGDVLSTEELQARINDRNPASIAAVGDVVSVTLKDLGVTPALFVCDYKTQRGDDDPALKAALSTWGDHVAVVENPAAQVTRRAWDLIAQAWRDHEAGHGTTRIVVEGEEDLLGIPAFLEAPLGAVVLYGMPGQGVVWVDIDGDFKAKVANLVDRLECA